MEKLKKEFEQLFTKNATEITACPRIRLYGNPQELWLWILNNFTPKVSRVELPVKPANGGQWQKCPKCDGQGIVSKPPWIAGDQNTWTDTQTSHTCNLCNGQMVIKQ